MNLENWDNITSIVANSIAIIAAIWAFLQLIGWAKRKRSDSQGDSNYALGVAKNLVINIQNHGTLLKGKL